MDLHSVSEEPASAPSAVKLEGRGASAAEDKIRSLRPNGCTVIPWTRMVNSTTPNVIITINER